MVKAAPVLEVEELSVAFGDFAAVKDLTYTLSAGESLGIVGESGSGKSVSLQAIMRLLDVKSKVSAKRAVLYDDKLGEIDLLNYPSKRLHLWRGNTMAMIFQEPMSALNPVLTVGYQVREVLQKHLVMGAKESKKRVVELFDEVELPSPENLVKRYPHQLSGGQLQRVVIAMALACKPKVLLADEPTTALDVVVQASVLQLLNRLRQEYNMALLFVSHDIGAVGFMADKVLAMYKGEVVESGSAAQVLNAPQHPYTAQLIASRPRLNKSSYDLGIPNYVTPPLLQVKELRISYLDSKKKFTAVKSATFQLMEGETLAVVGQSGSGKSSIGKCLVQLVDSETGEIIYKNKSVTQLSGQLLKKYRSEVQIIFQNPYSSLNPAVKVGTAINEVLSIHQKGLSKAQRNEKVLQLLEQVGLLAEHKDRYPAALSGGQRQRVSIARALAVEPSLLVLDEAVSALDVTVQAKVLELLVTLQKELGLTYLFITHDLAVVRQIAHRTLVLKDGEVVEVGNTTQVLEQPVDEYTANLLSAAQALQT